MTSLILISGTHLPRIADRAQPGIGDNAIFPQRIKSLFTRGEDLICRKQPVHAEATIRGNAVPARAFSCNRQQRSVNASFYVPRARICPSLSADPVRVSEGYV